MYCYILAKITKKGFPLPLVPLYLAVKYRTLFARCVLLSFIYLIFVCLVICLVLCIIASFRILLMNKQKPSFSLLFCAYYKLSHFFPYKDQAMFFILFRCLSFCCCLAKPVIFSPLFLDLEVFVCLCGLFCCLPGSLRGLKLMSVFYSIMSSIYYLSEH